jgi:hypothetical protein
MSVVETSPAERPKSPSRRRRWFRRIVVGLLAVAVLLALVFAVRHFWLERKLADVIAEMDRDFPGWKLDELEAARAPVADDDNSALIVLKVAGMLPARLLKHEEVPQRISARCLAGTPSGRHAFRALPHPAGGWVPRE